MRYAVEMKGITKIFPGTVANDNVDFDLRHGEIHALLGENGAGKSTLMNILYGLYTADHGEIYIDGKLVNIQTPNDSISHGIGMVHQHFMLVEPLTVVENIILGAEVHKNGVLDIKKATEEILALSEKFGLAIDPGARIRDITIGMQQRVEILKALYRGADILIMDEPTAVLTPQEIDELIVIMRNLTSMGKSIIFITHKLKEIMSSCDRVTVIRRGKKIGTVNTCDATIESLAEMMVGRQVLLNVEKAPSNPGAISLEVKDLEVYDRRDLRAVKGISFNVRSGEIVGIAGIEGNGQTELIEAITGLTQPSAGHILLGDRDITHETIRQRYRQGLAHVPQDRQRYGLVLNFSVADNTVLQDFYLPPYSKGAFLQRGPIKEHAEKLVKLYDIRTPSVETFARNLSGGNQQKVILARELEREPRFVLAAQPTRGLDVGAIEYIHRRLVEQRDEGGAILLISLELDEILSLCDRILVMYEGKIVGELDAKDANENILGVLMAGGTVEEKENG